MALSTKPASNPQRELSLIGHLDELRARLIICIVFLVVATVGSFLFANKVLGFLIRPVTHRLKIFEATSKSSPTGLSLIVAPDGTVRVPIERRDFKKIEKLDSLNLVFLPEDDKDTTHTLPLIGNKELPPIVYAGPLDPILMQFKVALILGILLSLVVWVWQIWLFIAPGLTDKERRVVGPMLGSAVVLFPIGAMFAYWVIFMVIEIMHRYVVKGIDPLYDIGKYLKFMTTMMIVFGLIFELPLVVALLARVGFLTPGMMRQYRRHIWVLLSVAAMIIVPTPDPFTMLMAWVPMVLLFEISVLVAKPMAMMRAQAEEEDARNADPT